MLFNALNHVQIKYLHVQHNITGDEGVEHLLSATNSAHVIELCPTENVIGPRGYEAISQCLQRDDTDYLGKLSTNCADG